MANSLRYHPGDKVVVRSKYYKSEESKLEVALVTNVNPAGKLNKRTYDVRTEAGSGMIQVSVDDKKSNQTIVSSITEAWIANGGTNNMFIHKKHGHTRANFASDIKLRADGEEMESESSVLGHYEKYNNFVFPTQGPRSF
tara:strand:+ start:56 stop:475 length:420 start_codon:yes stop_codon:yes gene_type:complete